MVANLTVGKGIGWAVRRVRLAQKRTLEDVAGEAGTDAGNLSRIERGSQNVPEPLLRGIASALGVPMSQLWRIAEDGVTAPVDITAKAGQMKPDQVRELNRFADFLLSQNEEQ